MVLGSYNNRIHNFELAMVSLVLLYILFLSAKRFPILKIKNVKRVSPKIIIKWLKERKRSKRYKIWTPIRDKNRSWKCANSNATHFYFILQNNIVCSLSKIPQSMMVKVV